VIGVGVLVNRSEQDIDFGAPLFSCHQATAISYAADKCPLCDAKIPLIKPGGG
jgi:orotate phosphoribosyltransferase